MTSMRRGRRDYIYIPPSERIAKRHLGAVLAGRLRGLPKRDFLKAYCSLVYLYPGFHPDDWTVWEGEKTVRNLLTEVWRRARAGQVSDNELYPYQVVKAALVEAWKSGEVHPQA